MARVGAPRAHAISAASALVWPYQALIGTSLRKSAESAVRRLTRRDVRSSTRI
jgi:hypothetical protein